MEYISTSSDERLLGMCPQCGAAVRKSTSTKDHIPPRSWLGKPLPDHPPFLRSCFDCNNGASEKEEYVLAFLSVVLSGTTNPSKQRIPWASKVLSSNKKLLDKLKGARISSPPDQDLSWKPDQKIFDSVILKNARGHILYELGFCITDDPKNLVTRLIQTYDQGAWTNILYAGYGALALWPEVGSRLMTRLIGGQDMVDGWIVVQDGIYRYRVDSSGLSVETIIYEYLYTCVEWQDSDH